MKNLDALDQLDTWVADIFADPISKDPTTFSDFKTVNGIIDARVFLKNTHGYIDWLSGQNQYESWVKSIDSDGSISMESQLAEINRDRTVYDYFKIQGDVLDVGGGFGLLREFLEKNVRIISVDPFIEAPFQIPASIRSAYKQINSKLNFIGCLAEFLPFKKESFDWVHMRSMLDHVQVPDLALKEAHRVLKADGLILIGLYVDGGHSGKISLIRQIKNLIKHLLELMGINKYKDFHTWHPTYKNLLKLIEDNGFTIQEAYWQPGWNNEVVYVKAIKSL